MIRFPWTVRPRLLSPAECPQRKPPNLRLLLPECREKLKKLDRVAVVGGGFAGLMAARRLVKFGVKVTVYEARREVGGRVLSNLNFSKGRITEEGAELIGSFHTKWLELARESGLAMISRMGPDEYEKECLDVRLSLEPDKFLPMKEFIALTEEMNKRVLTPIAELAKKELLLVDPSRPWEESNLQKYDNMSVAQALETFCKVPRNGRLWKMLEFKLVNDEVASLDKMNFLGLLCKVRAGQGKRCVEDDDVRPMSSCILDGYWEELEIFRCADGCQTLAKEIEKRIKTKEYGPEPAKVFCNVAIARIELSSRGATLWYRDTRDNKFVDEKAPPKQIPVVFSYVILAIPPSVWSPPALKIITADGKDADPAKDKDIGQMQMNDAVKHFSDVKERFWIKERPEDWGRDRGLAPYGGSFKIGQVWEGTDNQTRVGNQGIVLSVFAGPVSTRRPGRAPAREEFEPELSRLYRGYKGNLIKRKDNPLFANWPAEPFIKTGYWTPRPGDIWKVGEKLTKPYHDRLFFAGEHTQMDFFGYMEGALRSGERAAETAMLSACGLKEPDSASLVARAAPIRGKNAFQRESETPLEEELEAEEVWAELPEDWPSPESDEDEGESLGNHGVPLRDYETALPSPDGPEKLYRHCSDFVPARASQNILFVGAERGDEFKDAMRFVCQGHDVMVINPRETASARAFRRAGGRFTRATIEDLPPKPCRFDLICENYPYPSGSHYVPPRPFALARLSLLKPCGKWILVTESPRYASLLKAIGDYDDDVRAGFRSTLSPLPIDEAPPSAYPRADTRYRLIFQRCR
jgi:monoamine oxidase